MADAKKADKPKGPQGPQAVPQSVPLVDLQQQQERHDEELYWRQEFRAVREKMRDLEDEIALDTRPDYYPMATYYCPPGYVATSGGPYLGPGSVSSSTSGLRGSFVLKID